MIVHVKSFLPWVEICEGTYEVQTGTLITEFLRELGIEWDQHVLVGINERIANEQDQLADGDRVLLFVPITGG